MGYNNVDVMVSGPNKPQPTAKTLIQLTKEVANIAASIDRHSETRPSLSEDNIGYFMFDTSIGKPIWWNGSAWVDATGATV